MGSLTAHANFARTDPCHLPLYSSRLTIDDLGGRLEDLEFECQQGVELGLMAVAGIGQTVADRLFERPTRRIIPPREAPPVLAAYSSSACTNFPIRSMRLRWGEYVGNPSQVIARRAASAITWAWR